MLASNPFAELSGSAPPILMQTYVVIMIVLVAGGTLIDVVHKGSAKYFFEPMLTRGLELLGMLKEDLNHLGAEDLHQLQRAWELQHRVLASEAVTRHTMFRTETRWPGYYYRADHPKLDDANWHCFTLSRFDRHSGKWELEKAPVHHIVD
jgi:succinate dehydrogenase/fumarate reductase flavoprotein subunit